MKTGMLFSPVFACPELRSVHTESRVPDSKPPPPPGSRPLAYSSPPVIRDWNLQNFMPVTYLDATLVGLLVSVENKGLTENLNPLDATLTKNIGGGGCYG